MIQAGHFFLFNDDDDGDPDFEGPAAAEFGSCASPEGGEACRRMTMRPSECAEKMTSTTISSSAVFTVARGRCFPRRPDAGAAACSTRDVWC